MIVVTGAAGFIGAHLTTELRSRGHEVAGVDRVAGPGIAVVADLAAGGAGPGGALADALDAVRSAEAVFHLAGAPGVRRSGPEAERAWWLDNVVATEAVLAAVPRATPLVVTSSSSVYGGTRGARPSREDDPLRPRGGYARSKAAVEQRCAARLAAGGAVAVARPFTVAGEGQRPDMALARWIAAATAGRPLRLLGSPERRRDVTDVRQVARALAELAAAGAAGPVNVGTGRTHTLADLVAAVVDAVGPAPVVVRPAHPDEVDATCADTARCRRWLGWAPTTDVRALVRRQARAAGAVPAGPADPADSVAGVAGVV